MNQANDSNRNRGPQPTRKSRRPLRWIALAGGAVVLVASGATLLVTSIVARLPQLPDPAQPPAHAAALLLTRDGQPFAQRGARRDAPVDASALPARVVLPFIAVEDRRFYQHHGIDLRGTIRAAFADLSAHTVVQGGSTITQQLVKNTMFGSRQTLGRKFEEAVAAVWLEHKLTKAEILSRYLNTVYFGDGAYGLGAAARTYFNTAPQQLTLTQAAMLAGLVKAPSQLSPREHLAAAQARENVVLAAMASARYLTAAEALATPLAEPVEPQALDAYGGYFADWLYPKVVSSLPAQYGVVPVRRRLRTRSPPLRRPGRANRKSRRSLRRPRRPRRAGLTACGTSSATCSEGSLGWATTSFPSLRLSPATSSPDRRSGNRRA